MDPMSRWALTPLFKRGSPNPMIKAETKGGNNKDGESSYIHPNTFKKARKVIYMQNVPSEVDPWSYKMLEFSITGYIVLIVSDEDVPCICNLLANR